MTTENYSVQISLSTAPKGQYQKGNMLNIRGATVSEVKAHLAEVVGQEQADSIMAEFTVDQAVANVQAGFPGAQVTPQAQTQPQAAPQAQQAQAPQNVQPDYSQQPPAQGAPVGYQQPQAQGPAPQAGQGMGQGAPCNCCGNPKHYVPNGQYGPFWSCSNYKDQQHQAFKASGGKF